MFTKMSVSLEEALQSPLVAAALERALFEQGYTQAMPWGQGGSGFLFLACRNGRDEALLKIPAYAKHASEQHVVLESRLVKEASILRDFCCEQIPRLIACEPSGKYLYRRFFAGAALSNLPAVLQDATRVEIVENLFQMAERLFARFHYSARGCYAVGDFKPENLVVESDSSNVRLVDAGGARAVEHMRARRTRSYKLGLGKRLFKSPEQLLCSEAYLLDRRLDLFAFGATVFFVLAGEGPYDNLEPDPARVMDAYLAQYGSAVQTAQRYGRAIGLPPRVVDFVARCLHPLTEERPWDIDNASLW